MLFALPMASEAKDAFYIQPFNIVPGDTKTISLNLDNENVYRGFQTDVILPEGLSIAKNSNNSLAISLSNRASSFTLSSNEIGERTMRLVGYSAQYESISGNSGTLINIQVKASSDFAGGYVQLKNTIFSNERNQDVSMDDSQVLVQTKEQNSVFVANGELTAGKGMSFALDLTNETSLAGCQFDVVVPNGLSLNLEKCMVTQRSTGHQLIGKNLGNGKYHFTCSSTSNTIFIGHSGAILNLWIDAEISAKGSKTVRLENVTFSDAKAQTYHLDPISFDVNVLFVNATSIQLSESSLSLQVDDSRTLSATVLPENSTDKSVVWESNNDNVAIVDANGKVDAKAEGQCLIIAYSADRSVKAECSVAVTKIPVTVKVENVSRLYGEENPQFKISYEGFKGGDTEAGLLTSAMARTDANLKSAVGTYEVTLSGAESNKYSFNYMPGTLTITKAPLVISAGNYSKKQGDAMPEFKASYSGFKNGEDESVLTKQPVFSTDATVSSVPAEYTVNVSGAEAENYDITYLSGTLQVIAKKKQTITWNQVIEANVGSTIEMNATASSGLEVRYSYYRPFLVNTAFCIPEIDGNKITFPEMGSYLLIAVQDGDENYGMAADTIQVNAIESNEGIMCIDGIYYKYVDESHTSLKVVRGYKPYSGKVEIPAMANGLPVKKIENYALYANQYLTEVVLGNNVEKCGCEALGACLNLKKVTLPDNKDFALGDYEFNCDSGIKEIHCRSQIPYVANEAAFNEFVDYNACILYVPKGCKEAYAQAEEWKKFTHIVEEEVPMAIVKVKNCSREYGEENPMFEFETEGVPLNGVPGFVCIADKVTGVGTYSIEGALGTVKNTNVTFVPGVLTIEKAPLVVSAGNYIKIQGNAMPEFKASYSGFKNGEDESVLTKQPVFSTDATESSAPAEYTVNVSGAEAENYDITYQPGTLTVTEIPAPIVSIVNNELQISTELDEAVIYYTLDGTEPDENSKVYSEPISLYASCVIKAMAVVDDAKSKIVEEEYHDAQYPNIVKVGDLITANIINNGEENLPMLFSVTSVYPFEVTLLNKEEYVEGWRNEQLIGDIEVPAFVTSNGVPFAVKCIGRRALCASGKVTSLKLNEGLEYIAQEALRTIGRIKELVIPNSVKEIGSANIIDDMNLNTVVLGKGVEILHFSAFWSTNVPLKEIYSLNPVPPVCEVPDRTFEGMPDGVT